MEKNNSDILSQELIIKLKEATSGYIPDESFEKLILMLEKETGRYYYTKGSEMNLLRVFNSLYDKAYFLNDCLKYPHYLQILTAVCFNSNYLTDVIVRNPEYLYWVTNPANLNEKLTSLSALSLMKETTGRFRTFSAKLNMLRLIKRREMLRIGVKDITGSSDLKETTEQLAILAASINEILFDLCYNEILSKYGIKIKGSYYCMVSLGKLGGRELNYSSDVDLILFFNKNSVVSKNPRREYYEILTEAAYLFIQSSTAVTDKGYIYRVDFRLRPDGRNSPLCRTLKDYLQYYETRGEHWERQMLIKMDFAGGSRKLYDSFFNYMQHFIYPSSFLNSPLEQVARMKENIEKKTGDKDNIKTFPGGIRDIEFSVQALQLLNGGKLKEIRTGNTLEAITALSEHVLLSSDESALFTSAYIFYRKIEHYLQLMNDTQTHVIPQDSELLEKLSCYMGFKSTTAFRKKLDHTRNAVRRVFESVVGVRSEHAEFSVEDIGFMDQKKALNNYRYLQSGQGLLAHKQFDKQTIDAFRNVESVLLKELKNSYSPDIMLDNMVRIIKTRPLPSVWFHEFNDTRFFTSFLRLCQSAQNDIDLMTIDKYLGDLLLTRKAFAGEITDSPEIPLNEMIFTLSVQFTLGIISADTLSRTISGYLTRKIDSICSTYNFDFSYFITGMGSFATGEMTFGSDIDLVIIAENVQDYPDIQKECQKLFNDIKDKLRPFDADSRLRPEGKSSQLVWDINKYNEYLDKRAQNWELQSLTRIKFVSGSRELYDRFFEYAYQRISRSDKNLVARDIAEMRRRIDKQVSSSPQSRFNGFFNIKKSRGGLVDIEFILQYLMLINPDLYGKLAGRDTSSIIDYLINYSDKFISFESLKKNYSFLKTLELKLQILFSSNSPVLPLDSQRRTMIARELGMKDVKELEEKINRIIRSSREFLGKFIPL